MDELAALRDKLAIVIGQLRDFSAPAGSDEMLRVLAALDYCGFAYSVLQDNDNPAWGTT